MEPPVSGSFRGRAQGRAQGSEHVTPTQGGGVTQTERGGCYIPPFHVSLVPFGVFVLDRTTRTAPAVRERTGATPPF